MPALLLLLLLLLPLAAVLALADGDFTLMSKGATKREHFLGKVVWITGGSKGIGKALADQFASFGAKVIISARNVAELERVKNELTGKHPSCEVEILPMDLSGSVESLQEAVQKAESLFSGAGVEYMVHNAAHDPNPLPALQITEECLMNTLRTNVFGTITVTRHLALYMLKRGRGHFIVISSAAGKCPSPGQTAYVASKFALNGYFHTLRSELCQKGIDVTVICPGPVDTRLNQGSEKRISPERCAELIIVAANHGLKEAWISYQPVLLVMYLVQYMPTVGYWFMDAIGANRLEASANKGDAFSWNLFFGKKKKAT